MSNSIFMLSKYLKKTVTTALILGLMISPILPAAQSISSSISIAAQATEVEVQLEEAQAEEAQATTGYWSKYINTDWYYDNQNENENEYTIATAEELAGLSYLVNIERKDFKDKTVKITKNIDLGKHYWVPIGLDWLSFDGTFDAQGHTISNMHIGTSETPAEYKYAGLFGSIRDATIKDVKLEGCIYSSGVSVGGICAYVNNSPSGGSTISGCTYSGTIDKTIDKNINSINSIYIRDAHRTGGICGYAGTNTTIINCINNSNLTTNAKNAGGICGWSKNSTINNCVNNGSVTSSINVFTDDDDDVPLKIGGICGKADRSTINNCVNLGEIIANGDRTNAGGICGLPNKSTINNAYYMEDTAKIGIGNTLVDYITQFFTKTEVKDDLLPQLNDWVNNYNETNPDIKASNWEIKDSEIVLKTENQNATEQDASINTDDVIIESNISY